MGVRRQAPDDLWGWRTAMCEHADVHERRARRTSSMSSVLRCVRKKRVGFIGRWRGGDPTSR